MIAAFANAIESRSWATSSPWAMGFDARGKRIRKNSGIASWRSMITGTPDEPQRQRGEHEHVGDGVRPGPARTAAGGGSRESDASPRARNSAYSQQVGADPGALVPLHVEAVDADAGDRALGGSSPVPAQGEHVHLAARTRATASASRRTRGSSS